jgi:hypothetical protein
MKKVFGYALILLLFSGVLGAQNPADAAAAQDALRRLDEALSGNTANTAGGTIVGAATDNQRTSQHNVPTAQVTSGGRQPNWVNDPYITYPREHFIAAIGFGPNRQQAEARALAVLAAIFGQSIRSDFTVITMYTEAVNRGVVNVSENTNIRDTITRAASMDNLVGAEIGNIWDSGRGTVYAVAYMDRARTISIYSDMIIINNRNIHLLTAMSNDEKNTLDGYARFRLAAQIAGINSNYAAIITQLGGSTASLNLSAPDSFLLEATNIIRNITVTVRVVNDRANRIQDAFARVLSSEGLRTRGNNPRYTLEVRLDASEVTFPNNAHIFCRIEASANLIDNTTGASLLPFNFNDRAGHTTYANAEAAAFTNTERIIAERYPAILREYLASLIPMK